MARRTRTRPEVPDMRIGIDASELFDQPAGVGRYLAELLNQWIVVGGDSPHQFILYSPTGWDEGSADVRHLLDARRSVQLRHLSGRAGTFWQQSALRRAVLDDRPDVFFAPAYSAPLALPMPVVVAIHDVSFAAHPEWFNWRNGLRLRWLATLAGQSASMVLTLSAFSRQQIVEHLGIPASRIAIVRPGISSRVRAPAPSRSREPLVLFVGSLFNRRHVPDLIAAFRRMATRHPEARLAIVGRNQTDPRENPAAIAERLGIASQVDVMSYVPDTVLCDLYARARAFAFLSSYEGFALTPLEAMSAGVPPVLLDTPVAREVYRDAAMYVAREDISGVADALESLLYAEEPRNTLLSRSAAVVAEHSWSRTAREVMNTLERARR